jgi:hypothetical protein
MVLAFQPTRFNTLSMRLASTLKVLSATVATAVLVPPIWAEAA